MNSKQKIMIRNYFTTAYRILTRNKAFSLINIFGLSVALTSVLIIFLFITNELSFDKHLSKYDSIYRVVSKESKNDDERFEEAVPAPLSGALKSQLTGHNDVTQFYLNSEQLLRVGNDKYLETGVLYADTNFIKVFDVNFLSGNPDDLKNPNTIFLTEKVAVKYFGSVDDALNKEVVMMDSVSLNVVGVVGNPPKNTHLPYNVILPWQALIPDLLNFEFDNWGTTISGFGTYLTLKSGISEENINSQINDIIANSDPDYDEDPNHSEFFIQSLRKIHFDDRFEAFVGAYVTSKRFIWIFSSVGLFILIIAFINFTNLSIVQTIKRAKEVGIRKVLGADRYTLIKQFLGETFLILLIAEIISLILTEVVLSKINTVLGNSMELELYGSISVILFLLIVLISLTFLSGIYPASVLSRYNPIRALRYKLKIGRKKTFSLYNFLVVFQFFISQVLIVGAIVISLQINYFKNKDLGFDKENVLLVDLPQGQSDKAYTLAEILKQNPNIEKVSLGLGAPMSGANINSSIRVPGDETYYHANVKTVDTTYHKLYDLKFLAGEWYKNPKMNDSTFNIVVSKSLVQSIGIEKPVDAIDTYLRVFGSINGRIVGVIDDFHAYSLKGDIAPVLFIEIEDFFVKMSIKTNGVPYSEISFFIENAWNEILPEYIYNYDFLEETINARYESEQRVFDIIKIFTFIAIIVACLGLYGLVSFMLMQRTKEVGIRKAMGATVASLVMLVSKQFLKLVLLSCVIAWPVAYYLMNKWLQNYAFKIDLEIWIFLVSGIILIGITFFTILYQSIKVSLTNPVDVLKYE